MWSVVNGIHHIGGVCHRGGKMLTVDEANRKWQEYQAEALKRREFI